MFVIRLKPVSKLSSEFLYHIPPLPLRFHGAQNRTTKTAPHCRIHIYYFSHYQNQTVPWIIISMTLRNLTMNYYGYVPSKSMLSNTIADYVNKANVPDYEVERKLRNAEQDVITWWTHIRQTYLADSMSGNW